MSHWMHFEGWRYRRRELELEAERARLARRLREARARAARFGRMTGRSRRCGESRPDATRVRGLPGGESFAGELHRGLIALTGALFGPITRVLRG